MSAFKCLLLTFLLAPLVLFGQVQNNNEIIFRFQRKRLILMVIHIIYIPLRKVKTYIGLVWLIVSHKRKS